MTTIPPVPEFKPDPTPSPLSPDLTNYPELEGTASPWRRVDAQNRDRILEVIRLWFRRNLLPWTQKWQDSLVKFIADVTAWLNMAIAAMWQYIDEHTLKTIRIKVNTLSANDDATGEIQGTLNDPLIVLGIPRGKAGNSWWTTTDSFGTGSGYVVDVAPKSGREPQVGDYVVYTSGEVGPERGRYGAITSLVDTLRVRVTYVGSLQGPPGFATPGSVDVVTAVLEPPTFENGTDVMNPDSFHIGPLLTPTMAGVYDLSVSGPAWIRVYASEEYALADLTRLEAEPIDIRTNFGIYLDYVASSEDPDTYYKVLSPGVQYTKVSDEPLWVVIRNLDDAPASITLKQNYLTFRV